MRNKLIILGLGITLNSFLYASQGPVQAADAKFQSALEKALNTLERTDVKAASDALDEFGKELGSKSSPSYINRDIQLSYVTTLAANKDVQNLTLTRLMPVLKRLFELWNNASAYPEIQRKTLFIIRIGLGNIKNNANTTDVPTIRKIREDLGEIIGKYYDVLDASTKKSLTDANTAAEEADTGITVRPLPSIPVSTSTPYTPPQTQVPLPAGKQPIVSGTLPERRPAVGSTPSGEIIGYSGLRRPEPGLQYPTSEVPSTVPLTSETGALVPYIDATKPRPTTVPLTPETGALVPYIDVTKPRPTPGVYEEYEDVERIIPVGTRPGAQPYTATITPGAPVTQDQLNTELRRLQIRVNWLKNAMPS